MSGWCFGQLIKQDFFPILSTRMQGSCSILRCACLFSSHVTSANGLESILTSSQNCGVKQQSLEGSYHCGNARSSHWNIALETWTLWLSLIPLISQITNYELHERELEGLANLVGYEYCRATR